MMGVSKIGRRGQTTLPSEVRRKLQVEEGDRLAFIEEDGDFRLKPLVDTLLDLRGSIPVDREQDFEEIRATILQKRTQRH